MNFEGVTSSNTIQVPETQLLAFRDLLAHYVFAGEIVKSLDKVGRFAIYSDDFFDVYPLVNGEPDYDADATSDFLEALRPFVPAGDTFILQSVGHEGRRFPLAAFAALVTRDKVEYFNLPCEGKS